MMHLRHWLITVAFLVIAPATHARPPHKQALAQYFGPLLSKKLNDCRTCHLPDAKEPVEGEKPHNAFGARLAAVKTELRKAGKKTTIEARLDAILSEDSDGDGHSNRAELLAGRYPGEKEDAPTALETAALKDKVAQFEKFRASYPWRPFETVQRPPVPKVKNDKWVRNPIDAFVAAEQEANALSPRAEAPKAVLLRRVYIDLIGLPPTAAELKAFLEDDSPQAYEKVVDRLLASPQYGERWGRHWMDIWRYSDWAGFGPQVRDSQPHIWRWRDWIVDSVNEDKGYDRMILEMLAGDELAPEDPKALAGTGYLVRNYKLLSREKWMQDVVEHTSMAFLGLTVGCARCHDHMYDPIPQEDYYRLRAIFEPHQIRTDRLPGEADIKKDGLPRAYDKDLTVATLFFIRGDDRTPDKGKKIVPGVPEFLGGTFEVGPVKLPRGAYLPESRPVFVEETKKTLLTQVHKADKDAEAALGKLTAAADTILREHGPVGVAAALSLPRLITQLVVARADLDVAETRHDAYIKVLAAEASEEAAKGDVEQGKAAALAQRKQARAEAFRALLAAAQAVDQVAKSGGVKLATTQKSLIAAQEALTKAEAALKAPLTAAWTKKASEFPKESSGRRLALARWLADKENPLTARVAVNHIWLRHFGQALVPSVFDFGNNGRPATHPALVDWLAAELMEPSSSRAGESSSPAGPTGPAAAKPWSMKHLHRLIVTSATYRQASTPDETHAKLDRDNKYLWRYPPRRVEAEVVRDSIFHVAGKLDLTRGGSDIDYPLGLTVNRRSLYFRHAAEKQMEFLLLFDAAAVSECYERKHSIIPQQALALFNSELALKHSRLLARELAKKHLEAARFVQAAFERVLSRGPSDEERSECVQFIEEQTRRLRDAKGAAEKAGNGALPSAEPSLRARENLVHVLMNHHEFVTIR